MTTLRFCCCLLSGATFMACRLSFAAPRRIAGFPSTSTLKPRSKKKFSSFQETHSQVKTKVSKPFRLIVPDMGLDIPVVSGTDNNALRQAPGYDPLSALPGVPGNCVVASHRNVHGAYFWYLTKIKPGSMVMVQTARESLTYKVVSAQVMPESQTTVLENSVPPGAAPRLTLYTCTLPVSANRFVVVANLVARGPAVPGAIDRPVIVPEITSGPLHLLKDKALHARYEALLRYASGKTSQPTVPTQTAHPESG